ncbi:MAG: UDP-N-acetylglucosamine diphosphorylase [Parachlamydiaceae bacterium]|nr:UDP-N-acetylglucosamine diphosphorylase [Parachlamydiaceae bacterium]
MNLLHPSRFFDLSSYKHSDLFLNTTFVWEALSAIPHYLAKYPLGKIEVDVPAGVHLVNPTQISIGKGTVLEPGAYIQGPCIIGENCTVRHGAYIRGNFIAGDECVIGHDTEVKNSIFLNHACAAHFAYLGDSILGSYTNLGAGTKCANLKFDKTAVSILIGEERVNTGLKKIGAIIGDHCQTGCNSVLNPGTLFGKYVFCYPCVNVGGYIADKQIVKSSQKIILIPIE